MLEYINNQASNRDETNQSGVQVGKQLMAEAPSDLIFCLRSVPGTSAWFAVYYFIRVMWAGSHVHTSMGTMASFDPMGGRRFCSLRNWRGNCTRKPRIFFSSSWARAGSSFSKPGLERKPSNSKMDRTSLDGKQRNTWRRCRGFSQVIWKEAYRYFVWKM